MQERNLKGETGEFVPGVPGWNEKLASDSEAAVSAAAAAYMCVADASLGVKGTTQTV